MGPTYIPEFGSGWSDLQSKVRPFIGEEQGLRLFFLFIFISWRLITLQYCSSFCHTLT